MFRGKTLLAFGLLTLMLIGSAQGMSAEFDFPMLTSFSINGDTSNPFDIGDDGPAVIQWSTQYADWSKVVATNGATTHDSGKCYSSICSMTIPENDLNGYEEWDIDVTLSGSEPVEHSFDMNVHDTTLPVYASTSTTDGYGYKGYVQVSWDVSDYNLDAGDCYIRIEHPDKPYDTFAWGIDGLTWNTNNHQDQTAHVITYYGVDDYGNDITVQQTVFVDRTAPDVTITSPSDGEVVYDNVLVEWTVNDLSYAYAKVKVGSTVHCTTGGYSCILINLSPGEVTITVVAYDTAGNYGSDSVTITFKTTGGGGIILK